MDLKPTRSILLLAALAASAVSKVRAQDLPSHALRVPATPKTRLDFVQKLRLGSLDGVHDAFGRITDIAMDRKGRLFVADDTRHQVIVFDSAGQFVQAIGREGTGPGEFQSPWRLALDVTDSLFIWDSRLARISVFDPNLNFVRAFPVSPAWLINSIKFRPDGSLVVAAYGAGDGRSLRILSRNGGEGVAFGPVASAKGLAGFEASLLGGTLDVTSRGIVFSRKSPYEIWFFTLDGRAVRRCLGKAEWTSTPSDVVDQSEAGQALHWRQYVHSSRIVALSDSVFLNVIVDPIQDRRILDIVTSRCELLRRKEIEGHTNLIRFQAGRFVAVRTLDFPEVVVYSSANGSFAEQSQ